jgi:hypothetical protein
LRRDDGPSTAGAADPAVRCSRGGKSMKKKCAEEVGMAAMDTVHTRICTLVLPLVDVMADDYDDLPPCSQG